MFVLTDDEFGVKRENFTVRREHAPVIFIGTIKPCDWPVLFCSSCRLLLIKFVYVNQLP